MPQHVYPIMYRAKVDLPGLAPAGAYVWFDPSVSPSVRVVSFPFPNSGRILGCEMDGTLERCTGVILPQLSDREVEPSVAAPLQDPQSPQPPPRLTLLRRA
jgi:hypothetical protein